LEKPTEPKLETAKLPSESVQDKTKNDQNVETKYNDSSKPSDFDPFAKKISPKNKVSEEVTTNIPPLDVPPPAAPTFDPFKNDPLPQPADSTPQIPEDTTPSIPPLDVPPPPPAPTFNPFENDPLPALDQNLSNVTPKQDSNPFESVNSENNQSSVPLENIFNSPPESATEDNFNPFDLPADN
jgi:hypothetical protein